MPTTAFQKSTSWLLFLLGTAWITNSHAATITFPHETYNPTTVEHPIPTREVIFVGQHALFLNLGGVVKPPPECAFTCAGYNTDEYPDSEDTCSGPEITDIKDYDDRESALIKCLCTDRPFLHHILNCGFKACGPAINDALAFGYNICKLHNSSLPAPLDLLKEVNVTAPPSFELTKNIQNITYSDEVPPAAPGARSGLGRSYLGPQAFATTTQTGAAPLATGMGMMGAMGVIIGGILLT